MALSPDHCIFCGANNRLQSSFCNNCGNPLQTSTLSVAGSIVGGTSLLNPQQLLKQRYSTIKLLGKGGMGAVYKAEDTQFGNRFVAVKEMRQSGLDRQKLAEAADQFKHEAHLLAGLKHPSLPSIYDHFAESGRWYLVMDFIEGETLEECLNNASGNTLPIVKVVNIGIQLSKVLGYLHTRPTPIIFRDLKPSNVMLTPDDHVYLIDFGIARLFKPGQAKDTAAYGSAGYSSPEQYGKAQTTAQSDMYSLGATLHQMLSGSDPSQAPFRFAPLQFPGHPALSRLAALITQMLDMDVDKRPTSMALIRQELENIETQLKQPTAPTPYKPLVPLPPTVPVKPPSQLSSQISSLRLIRGSELPYAIRAFQIFLDDNRIGVIRRKENWTFRIQPGSHTIYLHVDRRSTLPLIFDIAPGENVTFLCAGADSSPYVRLWKV